LGVGHDSDMNAFFQISTMDHFIAVVGKYMDAAMRVAEEHGN